MARPFKKGVDYFPLDCVLDDKMRLIKAKFGLRGFAFVIILLQEIYGNEGYYYAIKENDFLLLINDSKIKQNLATDVTTGKLDTLPICDKTFSPFFVKPKTLIY